MELSGGQLEPAFTVTICLRVLDLLASRVHALSKGDGYGFNARQTLAETKYQRYRRSLRVNPKANNEPATSAFALGMEGLIPEAIREMEGLRSKHDVELGVAMALLHFHGKAKMVDRYERLLGYEKHKA